MQSSACAGSVMEPRTADVLTALPRVVLAPLLPAEMTMTTPEAASWFTAWHSGDWPAAYWSGCHSQPMLMLTPCTRRTPGSTLTSARRYVRARMTALDEVIQVPSGLRRITLRLTSSHAGAIPDSVPTCARCTYPPSAGSFDSA